MRKLAVQTDHNLREWLDFADNTFPVGLYLDMFSQFQNNAVNCHWHDAFEFSLVMNGEVDYYLDETHIRLKEGDCIFINANTMHSSSQSSDSQDVIMFTLVFPSTLLTGSIDSTVYARYLQPVINSALTGLIIAEGQYGGMIKQTMRELQSLHPEDFGFELSCLAMIARLWQATVAHLAERGIELKGGKVDRRYEQRAKELLSYIHEHYAEPITVARMAQHVGISRSECFRCFKRATNRKPIEYINQYRLTQAARLLLESDSSVTEICTACGFSSSSYFGKLFAEAFGVSPGIFRRQRKIGDHHVADNKETRKDG